MSIYTKFFSFMFEKFVVFGYSISLGQVILFGCLCSVVGYLIGSIFKR